MRKHRGKESEQGFTLIEMVVAVLIVAVMITVVTPRLISAGQRAEATACEQNQRNIRAALAEYDLLHGAYPTGDTTAQLQSLVDDNILDSVPKEPAGGTYVINDIDANSVTVECSIHNELGAP